MYNVLIERNGQFIPFDIFPILNKESNNLKKELILFNDYKEFIEQTAKYYFWGKCEYELIVSGWPNTDVSKKIDVYQQIMMNIDTVTQLFMQSKEL